MSVTRLPSASPGRLQRLIGSTRFWRVALAVLACVITVLALMPAPPSEADLGWDKLNHALAFFSLAVCARYSGLRVRWPVLAVVVALLLYGGAIELVQGQVGRDADWADLLADGVGVAVGMVATLLLSRAALMSRRR